MCWGKRPKKERRLVELVSDQNPSSEAPPRSKKGRERREQKEMSEEEQMPEERWRRVSMSWSLRERRSEEMTQLNTSVPWGLEVPFEPQRSVMAVEVLQNEKIFGRGKNGGKKIRSANR